MCVHAQTMLSPTYNPYGGSSIIHLLSGAEKRKGMCLSSPQLLVKKQQLELDMEQ